MPRCILLSYAHPDDETFMAAGLMAHYVPQGVHFVLACATLGQRGSPGKPPLCTTEELPRVREQELRAAAALTGINDIHLLGFEDQHLGEVPVGEIRPKLVQLLRQYRPQIVITFDPHGGNLHPDHVAISRFTSDAVAAAGDARFHPEAGPVHAVQRLLWTTPVPVFELFQHGDPAAQPGVDFLLDIHPYAEVKAAALHAHRTQHQSIDRCFFPQPPEPQRLAIEAFRQGFGPALAQRPETDLFAGVTG